jgi:UDP-N-acetylglucosamine 2-epimerase (non-hydrolysing)
MNCKKKVMLVFGTRPEAIKMAPLVHMLKSDSENFEVCVCVTAQHREMLDQVLDLFHIYPDADLNVMKPGQDLFDVTSNVLSGLKSIINEIKPNIILVHGDTTTSFAAALAGFYSNIPIAHVEAGLRTFDIFAPFPEEFNRQVTSKITKWHFAPTETASKHLINEGISAQSIFITGNTVIDSLFWMLDQIEANVEKKFRITNELNGLLSFEWQSEKFVLITGHRRENFGTGFEQICSAISILAKQFPEIHFVYPVHLNPNIQNPVKTILSDFPNIHLINPINYDLFVYLLKHSYIVLTDSGGIQEEAPSLGKPVLVMRDVTERPEAVSAGTVELVGANTTNIVKGVISLIENESVYNRMSCAHNPYGDGKACERIVNILRNIK